MSEAFGRYDGAEDDNDIRMGCSDLDAQTTTLLIGELVGNFEKYTKDIELARRMYPWASRFVMGYPLPSWQRDLEWTLAQKIRFIESIWLGVDLGSYLVNDIYEFVSKNVMREFSDCILDGQQRLNAIEEYLVGKFAVPDENGTPRFWADLPKIERRRFNSVTFARSRISSWDEALLRKVYDLRAFGGTPHKPEEKASLSAIAP